MNFLKTLFIFALISALVGCATGPEPVPGKAAIYGSVTADSHKALVSKAAKEKDTEYSIGGEIFYTKDMVDYKNLKEIYVCLIDPNFKGGNEHALFIRDSEPSLRSIAVAKGDKLRIKNETSRSQNFFIADSGEGFQAFPTIPPGKESSIAINMEGALELGSEEDENLIVSIFSRPGLISRRISSGQSYAFERLEPNHYDIIFWFWRLGYIKKRFIAEAGKNLRMDQVLSVDRIIQSRHEP